MKELTEAILFAAKCHSGQYRKDGRTPYINHPIEVMHLLLHTGNVTSNEILVAAVLHDVVEDTTVTEHELEEKFGKKVAALVSELTDDKHLPKEERKRLQLHTAHLLSPDARVIRISDKICNIYDILYAPPGDWEMPRRMEYLAWADAVVNKIRGTNAALEQRFDELMVEGRRFLGE
jgi:GTP diphosphokinase / guanosine-3',5'-bis(diphosphate) 3'-diphosphatase